MSSLCGRLTSSARSYASAEAANAALLQPPTASAGSVASATAPAQNLLIDFLNGIQSSIDNALGSILWFFLAPVVVPIFDAVLTAVLTAILEATLKALLCSWLPGLRVGHDAGVHPIGTLLGALVAERIAAL
jgi:hypothetical protein